MMIWQAVIVGGIGLIAGFFIGYVVALADARDTSRSMQHFVSGRSESKS